MLGAFTGKLGGPLGDLWTALIGEVKGVDSCPSPSGGGRQRHPARAGHGRDRDGALPGPDGSITTLQNSVFSTVPGSPAWVAKAGVNRVSLTDYDMSWEYAGRNAIQSEWKIEHAA